MGDGEVVLGWSDPLGEFPQVLGDSLLTRQGPGWATPKPGKALRHIRERHNPEFLSEPRRGPPGHGRYGHSDRDEPRLP